MDRGMCSYHKCGDARDENQQNIAGDFLHGTAVEFVISFKIANVLK